LDFIKSYKNINNSNKKEDFKVSNNITNTVDNIKPSKEYKDLEKLLLEEKNKNTKLNDKIKKLEADLYNERELNKILLTDTNNLNNLNNQLMDANKKIKELQNIINMKEQQIYQLNIKNNSFDNGINNFMPGDNIISILFESGNQKIKNFFGAYKDTETFVRIEEKLYDEFPEFKDEDTYCLVRGKKIKRFKTLRENGIKDRDIIQVHIYGEEF
jgi:hypothetical protein